MYPCINVRGLWTVVWVVRTFPSQVLRSVEHITFYKGPSPDGVSPTLLKPCAPDLASVYTGMLIPHSPRLSSITSNIQSLYQFPKTPQIICMNDFCLRAFTSVAMMCLEKTGVRIHGLHQPWHHGPPSVCLLQADRLVDDAVTTDLHFALKHLDNLDTYKCMVFLDYSKGFNTVHPAKHIAKLADLRLPTPTCNWILDFLMDKPAVVKVGNMVPAKLTISTGAPSALDLLHFDLTLQGDCLPTHEHSYIFKSVDDTTILGLITSPTADWHKWGGEQPSP